MSTNEAAPAHGHNKSLKLAFHGRVIDHLGLDMYQSPVAAIAELISNAWDADAPSVEVTLPTDVITDASEIIVEDHGAGMTFQPCQERYLNVGYNQRDLLESNKSPGGRHRPDLADRLRLYQAQSVADEAARWLTNQSD